MTTTDTAQAVYDNLIAAKPGDVFSFEQAPGQRVLIVVATAQLADPDEEPKASGGPVTNPPTLTHKRGATCGLDCPAEEE